MKQEFTLNVCKTLITLTLICISLDVYASGNWTMIGRTTEGKPVMLSPTGQRFVSPHYEPFNGNYRGSATSTGLVVGSNGATSAMPVQATVRQTVSKPKVMAAILEKARTGGKALGRFAVGNSPYGRAFALAVLALEGSKFFWSDDEGDFVRISDNDDYFIVKTNSNDLITPNPISKDELSKWCEKPNTGTYDGSKVRSCEISVIRGNPSSAILDACGSFTAKIALGSGKYNEVTYQSDTITTSGACGKKGTPYAAKWGVKAVKVKDYIPINLDEFIDEGEPEADSEPTEWVNTSEVEPDGEPEATVKGGTVAQTNPYTDPKDGKVKQTKWEFEDKDGDGDADTVRETTIERPDLPPNSPEAPELQPPTDSDTGDGTGTGDDTGDDEPKPDSASQPSFDLCKEYPDILACDKQPEKPDEEEFPEIPTEEVDLKFKPDSVFPNAGTCPQPVSFTVFDGQYAFNTQPICDMAIKLRPFLIALAWLVAAFFIVRTVKSEI